jgi:hypothetical protein
MEDQNKSNKRIARSLLISTIIIAQIFAATNGASPTKELISATLQWSAGLA